MYTCNAFLVLFHRHSCTVCHCRLNGVGPLHQHLASASHIRRVEIRKAILSSQSAEQSDGENNQAGTSLCNLSQHDTSPARLSTEKKAAVDLNPLGLGDGIQVLNFQDVALLSLATARPAGVSDLTHDVNTLQKETNVPAAAMNTFSWLPQKGPNGEAYVMRGDKGFCHVCNIELTSLQHCRQHIQGNKHIKKEKDVTCLSVNTRTENANLLNSAHQENNVRIVNNGDSPGNVYDFLGPGGHCFVCNVVFTSTQLANEHIAGQRHKKSVASQNLLAPAGHNAPVVVGSGQATGFIPSGVTSPGPSGDVSSSVINPWKMVGHGFNVAGHSPSVVTSSGLSDVGLIQTGHTPLVVSNSVPAAGHAASGGDDSRQTVESTLSNINSFGQTTGVTSVVGRPGQPIAHISTNVLNHAPTYGYTSSSNVGSGVISGSASPHSAASGQIASYAYAASGTISLPPPLVASRGPNGEAYIMNGNRGYCYICKLDLTSIPHAQSHLIGKKHKKKNWEEMVNGNPVNTSANEILDSDRSRVLMCSICNVPFSSAENARQHFISDRHKKKLLSSPSYAAVENVQETDPEETEVMKVYQPPAQIFAQDESHLQGLMADIPNQFENAEAQSEKFLGPNGEFWKGPSTEAYVMRGDRGTCYVCNIELTSPQHCRQHIQGSKHIKKVREFSIETRFKNAEEQNEQPFAPNREFWKGPSTEAYVMRGDRGTCNVCNIELTSPQHCRQHIQGSKHIKKEREFFIDKSRESVDPEQTKGMKVYQATAQLASAQSDTHGLMADITNPFKEAQEQSVQFLENWKLPNTEAYVIRGDKGICHVCNVELTSPQHCRQHIQSSEHIEKEIKFFIEKSHESVDPKQTEVMKVDQRTAQIASAQGDSHHLMADIANPFENAEAHHEKLLPSNREFWKGPSAAVYVMRGDKSINLDCNSEKSLKTVDPEQSEEVNNQPQSQSVPAQNDAELKTFTRILGSFNNSMGNSTIYTVTPTDHTCSLPTLAYSIITEEGYSNTELGTTLSSNQDMSRRQTEHNQAVAGHLSESFQSSLSSANNVSSESNSSASVASKTDSDILSQLQTNEQNSSAASITQTKDILRDDNLSSQQKEPLKFGDKEIEGHSNDYAEEHDNAGFSITENNLQPPDGNVTEKTVKTLYTNIKVENPEQIAEMSASEDNKYHIHPLTQPDEIQQQSHQSSDPSSLGLQRAPGSRLLAGVITQIQELSHSNDKWTHLVANKPVDPLAQPGEIQQTSHQNPDPGQSSSSALDLQRAPDVRLLNVPPSQIQQLLQTNGKETNSTASKSVPYYFNGSSGYCFCCSVELTSLQHANQHLYGQKHTKRLGQWELSTAFQNGPSQQIALTKPSVELPVQQHTEDNSYYFNGDRGFCNVCNIELTSLQHTQQHIYGKPHRRTRERFNKSQNGVVYPLNCQICSKIFTGQESAQQHFTSIKHKSRADVTNESFVVLTVVDEGRVIMKDGQVWHLCDICKVAMNTREQFLFHRESSKHKKECENSKGKISFSENGPAEANTYIILSDPANSNMRPSSLSNSSRASSSSRPSSVETVQSELDTAAIRSMQAKFEDQQIQDETNRQRVLDDNRHYLTYGQAPVVSRDIAKAASSGQLVVSQDIPMVAGSGQPLISQDFPKTTGSVTTTASITNNVTSAIFEGHVSSWRPVAGAVPNSATATTQSSVCQIGTDGRNQGPYKLHPGSSEYLSEKARHLLAPASSGSSQMYEDMWQSLRSDGGQNTGLDLATLPVIRYGVNLAYSSNGKAKSSNATDAHVSGPLSRPISQGVPDTYEEEDTNIGDDSINAGQNHLNSTLGDESFSNSGNLSNMIMKPRPAGRSRGNERTIDVLSFNKKEIDDEFDDGYEEEDRDNLNIIEEVLPEVAEPITPPTTTPPMRSGKPGFRYYCPICNKHMNTRETYETHIKGKNHIFMLSNQPAAVRRLEPICKISRNEGDLVLRMCDVINKELDIQPRVYQIELVLKAMKGDCIIYLPTGTGKTLVAVLTMGLMLQDNPSRPVLFLVDKVLLVMQQAQYIIRHFAGTLFKRQDGPPGSQLVTRELQVKPICGGMTTKTDLPVWKHDIVVTTAAYCANMLDRGLIRWEDFSLVVLDEVHHCGKGHPYHRLMSTYHCSLSDHARAKMLGLTASPAGKSTVEQTYIMLKSLLTNLGGASIAVVEENDDCLKHYQSMAKVKPICVPMSSKEKDFKEHLLEYFILCYSQLALMTNNLRSNEPPCSFFLDALHKPGDREVATQLAEKFIADPEPLSEVLDVIYKARCIDEADVAGRNRFDNLRLHICQLLLIIPEVGSGADIEDLLAHLAPSGITEEFKKMGLPCDQIYQRAKRFAGDGNNDLTMFSKLVQTLQDPDVINWTDTSSRALVLVRERKRARQYCLKLRAHPMVENKNLRVGHIVGHGKGAKDGGMDVKKQRKVFDNHEKYHILVATSIMEEGIDIQALQLVVCMNPPNSLRALVQMRGRARRESSHFVVLCSSQEDVDKLNSLQKQEQNMQEAAKRCLEEAK